ncbi:MAG: PAS domain S-box protein [Bacteroidetes bacterium]|nr:PAS domain S-box protein [Bacteroidota bacterium]
MFNKLLRRQLVKLFGDNAEKVSAELKDFLKVVSESYDHYEKDRRMLERSIEISSKEMIELNNRLKQEVEEDNKAIYQSLQESLFNLNEEQEEKKITGSDYRKLGQVAEMLKQETQKRKDAERERKKHQAHLEASQQIAHIGSWELDMPDTSTADNIKLYWSDETYRIFGFEPRSVMVTSELLFSRVHPEDLPLVREKIRKAIIESSAYELEYRLLLPDGTEKVVYEQSRLVHSRTNRANRMIGTIQDVTDRRKTREKLIKVNNEIRTLFENMQEVFFTVDMKTFELLQMSSACEKIYGYTIRDFAKNSNLWFDVILEEDKQVIYGNDATMRQGNPIVQEYRIQTKHGDIKWVESKITPTVVDGELIRIDGITSDITKRKEAEMAVRDNEQKFRSLIQNSADAILVLNADYEIVYASNSLNKITGFTPEEVLGVNVIEFGHPDEREMLLQYKQKVYSNPGVPHNIIYRRVRKDGTYIWCEGTTINLLEDDIVQGIVINFRDITQRRQYEDALKAANEDLQKTNTELDKFVYSVSHDLRAPLSSMMGVVELALTETEDGDMLTHLDMIRRSIRKLDGFIVDILEYSRNARLEVRKQQIDFHDLMRDVTENIKFMSEGLGKKKRVNVHTHISGHKEFISDKGRIAIILNNLVSNGIRYANDMADDPYVHVSVELKPEGAEIIVKDNGIGISKDKQEKVFDMFYRVSKSSVGSGLGLYLVREATAKLGGHITLDSTPGIGSSFTVRIPNLQNH